MGDFVRPSRDLRGRQQCSSPARPIDRERRKFRQLAEPSSALRATLRRRAAISPLAYRTVRAGTVTSDNCSEAVAPSPISVPPSPTPTPSGPSDPRRVLSVDNRITNGPTAMREDATPVRLTTAPVRGCGARGCNIDGTERWSGSVYDAAICQPRVSGSPTGPTPTASTMRTPSFSAARCTTGFDSRPVHSAS